MTNNTTMRFNVSFDLEITQDDIINMLTMRAAMKAPAALAAVTRAIDEEIGIGGEPAPAPAPEPVVSTPVPVAPTPAAKAAPKAAPTPKAAPVAKVAAPPAPKIPLEADLRATLKKVNAIHPKSTAGVVEMLDKIAGFKRLNECPPSTWPAIEAAAEAYLAEHAAAAGE